MESSSLKMEEKGEKEIQGGRWSCSHEP